MKSTLYLLILFILPGLKSFCQIKGSLWDIPALYKVPEYRQVSQDSVIGIIYNGLPYKGRKQDVFAWYASPQTLNRATGAEKVPVVVLVHGGGGTAFKEWVMMWAKKGYAAIAMDLRGNGPDKKHLEAGFEEDQSGTPYFTMNPKLDEQWMFQAVANVILANNLARSFREADTSRTAITGISWGGIITSLMAGLDRRYKAAVPVYGCGFLLESSSMRQGLLKLTDEDRQTWVTQYDPKNYLKGTSVPMLFVNGTNDAHFYLDSYAKTVQLVPNANLSLKIELKHSHHFGWNNEEIFSFIDSYLGREQPLARIEQAKVSAKLIKAKVVSFVGLRSARLNYTTDTTQILMNRKWHSENAALKKDNIIAPALPGGTKMWYLSAEDERGLVTAGPIQICKNE